MPPPTVFAKVSCLHGTATKPYRCSETVFNWAIDCDADSIAHLVAAECIFPIKFRANKEELLQSSCAKEASQILDSKVTGADGRSSPIEAGPRTRHHAAGGLVSHLYHACLPLGICLERRVHTVLFPRCMTVHPDCHLQDRRSIYSKKGSCGPR